MESLLYITFKDTVAKRFDNGSYKIAIDNIVAQLIAAAESIKADPHRVYSYLRKDTSIDVEPALASLVAESEPLIAESEPLINMSPADNNEDLLNTIFENLKRTGKSEKILSYLVQNSGTELTVDQLAAGASLAKNEVSSWLAQTGLKVPAIVRVSRGTYKFNPDRLLQTTNNN